MQQFIIKEALIKKAIERVENKLAQYNQEAAKIKGNWSNEDQQKFKDWNNWHDLQYRLEQRLWENWSNYKDWHYKKYDFNTYP